MSSTTGSSSATLSVDERRSRRYRRIVGGLMVVNTGAMGLMMWRVLTVGSGAGSDTAYTQVVVGASALMALNLVVILLTRRTPSMEDPELYERLAIGPVEGRLRDPVQAGARARRWQLAAIVVVLAGVGWYVSSRGELGRSALTGMFGYAVTAATVAGVVAMVVGADRRSAALRRWLAPLGLDQGRKTTIRASGDRIPGYAGTRHGRTVMHDVGIGTATTTVRGHFTNPDPVDPSQFESLTGLGRDGWHDVSIAVTPEAVVVARRGDYAGMWLLRDLYLAELVAGRSA